MKATLRYTASVYLRTQYICASKFKRSAFVSEGHNFIIMKLTKCNCNITSKYTQMSERANRKYSLIELLYCFRKIRVSCRKEFGLHRELSANLILN